MKRLCIVVEGQSEGTFVSQVLAPYLDKVGAIDRNAVSPIVVRTSSNSRGGVSKYGHLRSELNRILHSKDQHLVVSMMIDFFRLPQDFPRPNNYNFLPTDYDRAESIERALSEDISDRRFIPYIQMHEFEALLFASKRGFEYIYGLQDKSRCKQLQEIVDRYPNPEEINTSPSGAPSKRILAIVPEFQKDIDGNMIIMENGINTILSGCPKFRKWIDDIAYKLNER